MEADFETYLLTNILNDLHDYICPINQYDMYVYMNP